MNKVITILAALLCVSNLNAQTDVMGPITGQVWTKDKSPYKVIGDIQINSLEIRPGVTVLFTGNFIFEVSGQLKAVGMERDSIIFKKAPSVSSWKGIRFQNTIPGSVMSWCIVEGANTSGIRIIESLPNLSHCVIRNNRSGDSGGGLKISLTIPGDLVISDCTISNNITPSDYTVPRSNGGGIWVAAGNGVVRFVNCTIENNLTTTADGGVVGGGGRVDGNVEFIRCTIQGNTVDGHETIPGGASEGAGGGIYIANGRTTFVNSVINNNRATGSAPGGMQGNRGFAFGGGVYINDGRVDFLNSVIAGNTASASHGAQGGGIFANAGQTVIENTTLVRNNIQAIHRNQANVSVVNSIIYFNNNNAAQIAGSVSVTYSDVQGGFSGEGNINFGPVFYSSTCLQIVPPSPCIDAGDSISKYNDVCFPPSLGGKRNDMGAHGGPNACNWGIGCSPAVPTKCVTPPSGLISWWPGDGNANDIIGSNSGTLQNGATFSPGLVGQAFSFDGVNDYIRVGDSDKLRPSQLTVEAWVQSSVIPSKHYFIVAKSSPDALKGYELGVTSTAQRSGAGRGRFSILGGSITNYGDAIGSKYILDGNFHHIAGTYDGVTLKLYVDGILEALTNWSGPITYTTDDLVIGTRHNSYGDIFNGFIDEVSIYNRVLSAQEITDIYNAHSGGKCKSTVSVDEKKPYAPNQYALAQNYPNPFNPSTTILYELPRASQVEVAIFNVLGEKIRRLVNQPQQAGQHRLLWNGRDENEKPVPSGIYFYRLQAGGFVQTRKMILMQ